MIYTDENHKYYHCQYLHMYVAIYNNYATGFAKGGLIRAIINIYKYSFEKFNSMYLGID